jgi:hypothetical protein
MSRSSLKLRPRLDFFCVIPWFLSRQPNDVAKCLFQIGHAAGLAEGLADGLAEGLAVGLAEGLADGLE